MATAEEIMIPIGRRELLVLHIHDGIGEHVIPAVHSLRECNQMIVQYAAAEVYAHPNDADAVASLEMPDVNRPIGQVDGADFLKRMPDGINAPPVRTRPRRYNQARNADR